MLLQTEFAFTLPMGYADEHGELHREGVMRLATAADEILPMRDPRVQQNPSYLTVILLSRVVTKLGAVPQVNPGVIEKLFASDFAFLQSFYEQINGDGACQLVICPNCRRAFQPEKSEKPRLFKGIKDAPRATRDRTQRSGEAPLQAVTETGSPS